ncbi:bifunctional [glutamate--ammonia ligase]-adenylyl-L-tyrosine phosphorylase/[glutamate--ammonia-ligase] adenylyltransferase [Polynucleobacter sp. MWH-Spelu-300-X4]|uniref:bifunctional [glutamate--ammonia ligase]-adenylyl-L-tyrosine phosphorylase/[glutamate--ammonia-ligase] adenylyltransferase n=1 Tax=Polynucleobacter sp. MWH-Spelu-300-X4 TaxID=2689109 RepID=UPI001BFCF06B|nr:bifunctional [glutamate--ammonia ligase]-adenylyl-L-tyrosine phosphorylase/[glutamate--ammonia-ligase] adenylyltransferase [Polynucleobacter sp. MWH-Spelu-300-X4]QWD79522.1 bifunctional [glutamate--ammonia ligase]-adenylyl-L-tyrosine phosphorylase/[glutamate--ammonia-ligase] adenylyltransferase [Polynucleobacter sp. MWH-Spelu-300-X4]
MTINDSGFLALREHSSYANRWLNAQPSWLADLAGRVVAPIDERVIDDILSEAQALLSQQPINLEAFSSQLRLARQRFMLLTAYRDLNELADLKEVTEGISLFAEKAIAISIEALRIDMKPLVGEPLSADGTYVPLMVVGMGKLGGRELNVSSDIDLVFVYEDEGDTQGGTKSISHHEWYTRLGKKLISLLSELTAEGFVFRVDMRLRPNGDSGPLVCSLGMLEEYFSVQGREWERYAWIKGRMIYPPEQDAAYPRLFKGLQDLVRPFVYRRYLDFGVIAAIRELHGQIQQEAEKRSLAHPERAADIKLGRGGIREIEFMAQMFQLVRGGQDPGLRIRPTLEVLHAVYERQLLSEVDLKQLTQAYDYFRKLEHRLQYWEDAQTHHLPGDDASQARLAKAMGHENLENFRTTLAFHRGNVAQLFANAFVLKKMNDENEQVGESITTWAPSNEHPEVKERWEAWLGSARYRSLTDVSRRRFITLVANSAEYIQQKNWGALRSDEVLVRMMNLLESVSRRSSYLALLSEYPHVLGRLIQFIAASKWGTEYLIKHPHLLDDLLTGQGQYSPEDHPEVYWERLRAETNILLDDAIEQGDHSDQAMDVLRQVHHTETFLTLLAELGIGRENPLPIEKVSDRLSALADLILGLALERVWPSVAKKYQLDISAPPKFAVIAYGKLGGKELGYASDLDVVFLYDAPKEDQGASERYAMFARRLIAWLTTATSAGVLFEIDTRLRPNGTAGLLVTNIDSFRSYQLREENNSAWVWEHQALTRARFCAGDKVIGQQFEEIRNAVLSQVRDKVALKQEILSMRQKVMDGHPNDSGQFDIKHDSGGMVDIEFIVQYLVLQFSHNHQKLLGNWGNIALLLNAGEAGLIPNQMAQAVADAYRLYREYQHRIRLDGADKTRIKLEEMDDRLKSARLAVQDLWRLVLLSE